MILRLAAVTVVCTIAAAPLSAQEPIIDMHLHAWDDNASLALCIPWSTQFSAWERDTPWGDLWMEGMTNPPCDEPIRSAAGPGAIMAETVAVMERLNIYGVLAGQPDELRKWRDAAPGRFMPSLGFRIREDTLEPDQLRNLIEGNDIEVLGEISNQYAGIAPNDPRMDAYWALAEELDIAVAIHMGDGTVGTSYLGIPSLATYRASLSNPFLLEDVLVRHPRLRVSVMHYGAPLVDEMIAVMASHPQVYIDIGGMQWFYPRAAFYEHLRKFIDAGYGKRIMFGSDQGNWPGVIETSIRIIEEAPFLDDTEKRDIFYNNAARFLRLTDDEIARHHAAQ